MKSVEWEEYLNIPVASDEDIKQIEHQLGLSFPEEFKQVLKIAQGKTPVLEIIDSEELCEVPFGPVFHVLPEIKPLYSIKDMKEFWDKNLPGFLPIAEAGDGCIFAYDLRKGAENPPVIFINADVSPDDDDSILFVANSLTELLSNLKESD